MPAEPKSFYDKLNDWFEKHPKAAEMLIVWLEKLNRFFEWCEHNESVRFIGKVIGTVITIILVPVMIFYAFKASAYFCIFLLSILEPIMKRIW